MTDANDRERCREDIARRRLELEQSWLALSYLMLALAALCPVVLIIGACLAKWAEHLGRAVMK